MLAKLRVPDRSIPQRELTSQVTVHDLDHHGVCHPIVPLPDALASLVQSSVYGLYQALGAEEGEVNHNFPNLFCASILGMAQLVMRILGPIRHVEDLSAYQGSDGEAVKRVTAQKRAARPDRLHLLALFLTLLVSLTKRRKGAGDKGRKERR